jgi:hypothetical protein
MALAITDEGFAVRSTLDPKSFEESSAPGRRQGLRNDRADLSTGDATSTWPLACGFWCPWQDSNLQPAV